VNVCIFNTQSSLTIDEPTVKALVKSLLDQERCSCDEVSIHFVDTPKICQLHAEFFDDPSSTDCITFPMDQEGEETGFRLLGDVFVCPATALEYTKTRGSDPLLETTLYIVHGLLHLLGFDDIDPKKRKLMRAAEKFHMKRLVELDLALSTQPRK
jgi:probable rRNA maturation factor